MEECTKASRKGALSGHLLPGLVDNLEACLLSHSWKVRETVVRLVEMLGCHLRMLLFKSPDYSRLISIGINALLDSHSEVRQAAKQSLASLFMTCTSAECKAYTDTFRGLSGHWLPTSKATTATPEASAGVLGLSALVQAVPYHVPEWLPKTITLLARYGNAKAPDTIRREVEKCLQEFFRTHQDAWQQLHSGKFSQEQLDILETYKGRPIYFA